MSDKQENTSRDKQARAEQMEQRGLVTDVGVPIAQSLASGAGAGYVAGKIGQGKNPPPEKKDS